MECFSGDVNRMECGGGEAVKVGLSGFGVKFRLGEVGIGRLCVVCATTETCCKCNIFIQNHTPG